VRGCVHRLYWNGKIQQKGCTLALDYAILPERQYNWIMRNYEAFVTIAESRFFVGCRVLQNVNGNIRRRKLFVLPHSFSHRPHPSVLTCICFNGLLNLKRVGWSFLPIAVTWFWFWYTSRVVCVCYSFKQSTRCIVRGSFTANLLPTRMKFLGHKLDFLTTRINPNIMKHLIFVDVLVMKWTEKKLLTVCRRFYCTPLRGTVRICFYS
jgi:hypothetical protein